MLDKNPCYLFNRNNWEGLIIGINTVSNIFPTVLYIDLYLYKIKFDSFFYSRDITFENLIVLVLIFAT